MRVLNHNNKLRGRLGAVLLVGLILSVAMIAGAAEAGWFGKNKDEAPKSTLPHRFDRFPTLSFKQGTIYSAAGGGWRLDETPIYLTKGCLVSQEGAEEGQLRGGQPAIVSGTVIGGQIFATHINMLNPDWNEPMSQTQGVVKDPSETNARVGILKQAPH